MEDKELQELFSAKRTVEANRRRQEELRRMLKKHDRRPLWPVWAGAVAAGIAAVLITLPALFRTESVTPLQVAETEVPVVMKEPLEEIAPVSPKATGTHRKAIVKKEVTNLTETIDTTRIISTIGPTETAENTSPTEYIPTKPAPCVHRRTSTRMVNAPSAPHRQPSELGQLLADAFCQEESKPIVQHTFTL